jgi:hypothetical protein
MSQCQFCHRAAHAQKMCDAHYRRWKNGERGTSLSAPIARKITHAEPIPKIEEHRLKLENRQLKRQLDESLTARICDDRFQEFVSAAISRQSTIPDWITTAPSKTNHEVMPCVSFSDWHFDEVVRPEQIQYINGYDREIAEKRLRNFFQNTIDVSFKFLGGFRYPGIVVSMLGDNFSGNIHEELRNTNADVLLSSLLYWIGPMVSGLKLLADAFGKVYVPVVVGNHGRNTLKPINKMRVRDNFDWLWANLIARELSDDKRITFSISESPDFTFRVYNTTYLITHGDQAKGGTGIAAQWSPLMLLAARKQKRVWFDYMVCGHWHRLGQFQKIRLNGSGKGTDEFSFNSNFEPDQPQQDLWLTDPHRGIICSFPVHVMSKNEPWIKKKTPSESPYRAGI